MKFSVNILGWRAMKAEDVIKAVSTYGWDGVELPGIPKSFNTKEVHQLIKQHNLETSCICGTYRDAPLCSPDEKARKQAVEYVHDISKMAADFGAKAVVVVPRSEYTTQTAPPELTLEKEWTYAVESLRQSGKLAADLGVKLAVEPLPYTSVRLINRVDQAVRLVNEVGLDNIGIVPDTNAMHIEEVNSAYAIRMAGDKIVHFHFSDSNRQAVGRGNIDFKPIFAALKAIRYEGYLSTEPLVGPLEPVVKSLGYIKELWEKSI